MAILLFLERTKFVVEGAGAVALAALLKYTERFKGKRVVLIASGGNIDLNLAGSFKRVCSQAGDLLSSR
jgi:threonine dehydratase